MGATVRVPNNVVHRSFAEETVVLNLDRGVYFGLNRTAGRMLECLESVGRVRAVAEQLADEFGQPVSRIQVDLCRLCVDLLDRGLIELDRPLE